MKGPRPFRVELTASARDDLAELWAYLATSSPATADRVLARVMAACQRLSRLPHAGRPRDELRRGVRSVPVGNLVVFYSAARSRVTVLRVVHGARDLTLIFDDPT